MEENLEAKDWVQWEEVIYLNFYSVLESIIPKWKKLIHEIVHSLSKDVIKQRQADYSLGYDRGDLSVGYSNGLWPVVGKAVPPFQFPQPRQHLEICKHLEIWIYWLLQCLGTTGFWVS